MGNTKRQVYLDALRIIAIMCVIFNHSGVNGFFLYTTTDNVAVQCISIFISSFCKIGVLLFFMISGALLLGKNESIKDLVVKRILRYVVILCVYCTIYFLYRVHRGEISWHLNDLIRQTATGQVYTPYWFLYSYLGFLIGLPILRKMAQTFEKKDYLYLFALYVLAGGVFGVIARTQVGQIAVAIPFTGDIIVYPMLGYFLAGKLNDNDDKSRLLMYLAAAAFAGLIINVAVTQYDYRTYAGWSEAGLSLFVIFPAAAVFLGVKNFFERIKLPNILGSVIVTIGSCTFGVYLLEVYIKEYCGIIQKLMCLIMPKSIAAILYLFCIMLIGAFVTYILKKIPVVRRII